MGLTHYFGFQVKPNSKKDAALFAKAVEDCDKLRTALKIDIGGWDGEGSPEFSEKGIIFNGKVACETFTIEPKKDIDFCKTEGRPYDMLVRCCLIVFRHYFQEKFYVSSDDKVIGACKWGEAARLCMANVGYGEFFELSKK